MKNLRTLLRRPLPPRVAIVQAELDRFTRPRYLEIGVDTGVLFLHLRAAWKVGVDPSPGVLAWKRWVHPFTLLRAELIAATSDAYFAGLAPGERFDVVFVDGDHAYLQSLRDIENALDRLGPGGVILVHDCNPQSPAAASPTSGDGAGEPWCGEVWKAIARLRATRADLDVHTLDADFGVGVVRRRVAGAEGAALELDPATIEAMGYEDLEANRGELLGLRAVG